MSEETKLKLISGLQTFVAGFIFAIATEIINGAVITWTWAFFGALLLAGVRAGVKVVFQKYAPEALGGVPKRG